jgi:hypothetical protein
MAGIEQAFENFVQRETKRYSSEQGDTEEVQDPYPKLTITIGAMQWLQENFSK